MFIKLELLFTAVLLPSFSIAQAVFAHVVLGIASANGITTSTWVSDMQLAARYGIDGFVLNFSGNYSQNAAQLQSAFQAANQVISSGQYPNWRMFFSFDYNGQAWNISDILSILHDYGSNPAHYQVNGKPMVSTFEGGTNQNDWATVRSMRNGSLYFVPEWSSLGPTTNYNTSLVDGGFIFDSWPDGPADVNTTVDNAWDKDFLKKAGKTYMMPVAPWFYVDSKAFYKAWVWRSDKNWFLRWNQTLEILPDWVEIVTWNDYGESHYIGPIHDGYGVGDSAYYVNGNPHTAWLETLPYQIAMYKHAKNSSVPAPTVASGKDKIVYWYRRSPASQGKTEVTGNCCKSDINVYGYQNCYAVTDILEDQVFAIVLAAQAGTASITIGSSTSSFPVKAGQNLISKSFGGNYGNVSVAMGSVKGTGPSIFQISNNTTAIYNAWTGCAGSCSNPT